MEQELKYSSTGKVIEFKEEEDHISIGLDYDDFGSQYGSFPKEPLLKELFPVGEKVTALFDSPDPWRGRHIKGLRNNRGFTFIIPPIWEKEYNEKQQKEWEIARKKEHERLMAIPMYRYESKYQFPDDMNIAGGEGNVFRNSIHVSISRGMEFMEGKDVKDFSMREYSNIKGISEDNENVEKLKDHIEKYVTKELGNEWGHSGFSMIYAVGQVLKAKEVGWDNYIQWIRGWKKEEK